MGSTGQFQDNAWWRVSRFIGSDPTQISCHGWEVFENLAGDVAFQTAHDLGRVQTFGSSASDVLAGLVVGGHAGEDDAIQGGVGVAVSSPV